MAEYIEREAVVKAFCESCSEYIDNKCTYEGACDTSIIATVPVADVQPVAETENMATVSDDFICKKCGIYLKDYVKVVLDEDNDGYVDEQHYEYEPKFCPECGAKVKQ